MLAQLPSGRGKRWVVTLDGDRYGRILNIRTRQHFTWLVAPDGKTISIRAVCPAVPKHCIETVQSLLRRPKADDLLEAAKAEISCMTTLVYDLAANLGQQVDNVKDMNWFIRRVEDRLITEFKRFSHLAPNYKEQT